MCWLIPVASLASNRNNQATSLVVKRFCPQQAQALVTLSYHPAQALLCSGFAVRCFFYGFSFIVAFLWLTDRVAVIQSR